MKVAAVRLAAQTHQVRGEDDVRVVEQRVVLRRFGVEDVQPDAGEPAVLQRLRSTASMSISPPRPQLTRIAPGLVSRQQSRRRPGGGCSGVSGRCRVMTSLRRQQLREVGQRTPAGGSLTGS